MPRTLALRAPRLIDGTGADARAGASVVIQDGRIRSLGDDGARADEVIELDDCTLLPGLIDAHTHLGILRMEEQFDDKLAAAEIAARIFENARTALMAGFTSVRDVGGVDGGMARAIERGLVPGPRLFPSGPVLCQTGGHGDFGTPFHPHHHAGIPGLTQLALVCDGPDEVRRAARTVLRRGATQVKVCVSGGVVSLSDSIDDTQFSVDELRAAVEEAHARHTYVTAHAHVTPGIRNGLAAGVECFEHGTFLDEETAAAMAAAGAALVPTLAVGRLLAERWRDLGIPESVLPRMEGAFEAMGRSVKVAADAGVTIGSGSDLFGPEQSGFGREVSLKATILSPMGAIVSATGTNARILRVDDRLGTIAAGKLADLIAMRGDPLRDPELFDDPDNVVLVLKEGRVVKDARHSAPE